MQVNQSAVSGSRIVGRRDTFDVSQTMRVIWNAKWTVAIGAVLGLVVGISALHFQTPKFSSYAMLRPNQNEASGGRSNLLSAGALSGLAGVLGLSAQGDFDAFAALLDSDALGSAVITRHPDVLQRLFPKQWDEKSRNWVHSGIRADASDFVRNLLGMQPWHPPGPAELSEYIRTETSVSSDFKTKMLTISYTNEDPAFAREFVEWVYTAADDLVRQDARARARARIAYLENLLPTVNQIETRQTLSDLLASEEQRMMMVQADPYFTVVLVKPPLAASRPSSPSTQFILGICVLLGAGLGAAWPIFLRPMLGQASLVKNFPGSNEAERALR